MINGKLAIGQVAGGIVGMGSAIWIGSDKLDGSITFKNCVNHANVTVNKQHAGGLWGSITNTDNTSVFVEDCHNYGAITSLSQDGGGSAGGFGGYFAAKSLTITNSTNEGTVSAEKNQGNFIGDSTLAGGPVNE